MSATKLKPCPFCGRKVTITHEGIEKIPARNRRGDCCIKWSIFCTNCGMAKAEEMGTYFLDEEGAFVSADEEDARKRTIDSWNRRAEGV